MNLLFIDHMNYFTVYQIFKYICMFPVAVIRVILILSMLVLANVLSLVLDKSWYDYFPIIGKIILFLGGFYFWSGQNNLWFRK